MLGDWVAEKLSLIGITEQRYKSFKERFGMLPECNCPERREWLNKFGQEFGHRKKKLLKFLLRQ